MTGKYAAHVVFFFAISLSIASIVLAFSAGAAALALTLFSVTCNVWCLFKSEREGFGTRREMRRAHEPPRYFGPVQTLALMALLMGQVGAGAYVLLAA